MADSLSMRQTRPDQLVIAGELNTVNIGLLVRYLRNLRLAPQGDLTLLLDGLDASHGASLALFISLLRELRLHQRSLTLVGAPQVLGHNLYRANLLVGTHAIQLVGMREDEPYA